KQIEPRMQERMRGNPEMGKSGWCQRRDSNSQTPVSKTGRYSNSRTLALFQFEGAAAKTGLLRPRQLLARSGARIGSPWCTGEDLNLRVLHRGNRVTAGPFQPGSRTCASWRKVDESNAHGSSPCPGFQDQLPAIQQYLPHGGECGSGAT